MRHRTISNTSRAVVSFVLFLSLALPVWPQQKSDDLTTHSLEDLMNIRVTSVSKKEQKLSRAASAIFVITPEDIRRSGATNIPDVLRMVPGLDVAQMNASTWAVSARGFNREFSNELLVMVDGRTVYIPTFGGVFWDVLDLPLEDIERIEVIRGPGGSVWGANAVNGVINIITKKAADTHGAMAVAGGGNLDQGFGTVQYGGRLGERTDYRFFTKYLNNNHMLGFTAQDGGDGWHMLRGGFRMDSALSPKDSLMVQGDLYNGREGQNTGTLESITSPALQDVYLQTNLSGGYLQTAWNHSYSARSATTLQISFDRYTRNDALRETRNTLDVDFQHHFAWGERQDVVWGLDYRYSMSGSGGNLTFSLHPSSLNTYLVSSFVQDEIALVPNRLYLTAGTKLEHNYYTGFVAMPSARVAWEPGERQMFWVAISKATRTPSSVDASMRLNFGGFTPPGGTPVLFSLLGNPRLQNEGMIAYEAGYRASTSDHLSIDLAAYFNSYDHRETAEPSTPFIELAPPSLHLVMPLVLQNKMHGETHGVEIAANWKVTDRWTLSPGYALERIHMHLDPTSLDTQSVAGSEGRSPLHSAQFRSHVDLPHGLAWDASAYFVDRLPDQEISSYTRLDTGLTWRWKEGITLGLVGQNLLRDHHLEFLDRDGSVKSTLIKRGAYAKLTWRF